MTNHNLQKKQLIEKCEIKYIATVQNTTQE